MLNLNHTSSLLLFCFVVASIGCGDKDSKPVVVDSGEISPPVEQPSTDIEPTKSAPDIEPNKPTTNACLLYTSDAADE